jgi:hypothetical protein
MCDFGFSRPRPFLPLFTGVRGRGILRSPYPRSCVAPTLVASDVLGMRDVSRRVPKEA